MNNHLHREWVRIVGFTGTLLIVAAATAAEIQVAVDGRQVVGSNDRFWANAVFHPTEFMDSDWGKEHVKLLHDGGVTSNYIRFYNQFEDAAYVKDDGTIGYRWDHFDRRADWALAQGSKLLISFYSMPPQIEANAKQYRERPFLDGKKIYIGPPKDYRQWQAACADFTRHAIERYGEDRVVQWLFTCWNEPDLAGFWKGRPGRIPQGLRLFRRRREVGKSPSAHRRTCLLQRTYVQEPRGLPRVPPAHHLGHQLRHR